MFFALFIAPAARIRIVLLLLVLSSVSCTSNKRELIRAQRLEEQGDWDQALSIYTRVAAQIPATKRTQLAEVESHIGRCLIELGRGTDALVALQRALSLDSDNYNAHLRAAQLFAEAGVPERAEPHIAFAELVRPHDPEMLQARATFYAAQNREDIAERDLLEAYRLSKDDESAARQLAEFYVNADKPQEARSILQKAEARHPQSSRLRLALARLAETEGDTASAEAEYRSAVAFADTAENNRRLSQFLERNGRIGEAESVLHHLDELQTSTPFAAADLELQVGHPEAALSLYAAADAKISRQSGMNAMRAPASASLKPRMIEAALSAASSGDHQSMASAQRMLEHIHERNDVQSHLLSSEIALANDDLLTAQRDARAAEDDPGSAAQARYLLGQIAAQRGERDVALANWKSAEEADPHYVPARIALAGMAIQQQDAKQAEEQIEPVVRDEPANVHALLLYARVLILEKRYDSAEALCLRAQAADGKNAQVPMLLGEIALRQNQLAKALLEYEKSMLLDPYSEKAMEGLTDVYERGGASVALLQKLEKLADSGTPSSRLMEIAGRLYARKHENASAVRCLRRAIQMDPKRASAKLALADIYQSTDESAAQAIVTSSNVAADRDSSLLAALDAQRRGNVHSAIKHYETAIGAGDSSGIASNNLAWLYASQGIHLDRALELAARALRQSPGSPEIFDTLGMVEFEKREFSRAIAHFQRGITEAKGKGMADVQHQIEGHLSAALAQSGSNAAQ